MNYPAQLPLKVLLAERQEYSTLKPHLSKISLLSEGGWRLKEALPSFLTQRPGEEKEVYENRLSKFSYSNVLGGAIAQLTSKFSNGTLHVSDAQPESFWADFRDNTDGNGRNESKLVGRLLSELIKYRYAFVQVDKPRSAVAPLNRAQEQQLNLTPNILIHSALHVPMWHSDESGVRWVKLFHLSEDSSDPTHKPLSLATWRFIDSEQIVEYSSFVKWDAFGKLRLVDGKGDNILTENVPLTSAIKHGFGRTPVELVEVDHSLWSGNQAYPVAEQCLALECHRYALESAAYLQRSFKKPVAAEDTLDKVFLSEEKPLPTGLQYVLELDAFEWNEPAGLIIGPITETLREAEKQIRTILAIGGAYIQEGTQSVSGASKKMDFEIEENRLESYGHVITRALTAIYRLVAVAAGYSTDVTVSGLEDFGRNRLDDYVSTLTLLSEIDFIALQSLLTPTLFNLVREKLINFLLTNLSAEQQQLISAELSTPQDVNQADNDDRGDTSDT